MFTYVLFNIETERIEATEILWDEIAKIRNDVLRKNGEPTRWVIEGEDMLDQAQHS